MTPEQFRNMKKRGVFTMTLERIETVTNHIAEGLPACYTKKEAAECAQYWSLEAYYVQQKLNALRDKVLLAQLKATNEMTSILAEKADS